MSLPFTKFPTSTSTTIQAKPFKVNIPESTLDEFKTLLKLSKLGPQTYENSQEDRRFGVTAKWMKDTKDKWLNDFDWKKHEAHINTFPHYIAPVVDDDGKEYSIHFVALFSEKTDAVPVVFIHGWPGSFLEFLSILTLLKNKYTPETLPYHVIVPSLPGYTFSSAPPLDQDFLVADIARIFNKLLIGLGFGSGYVVQGGDIGSEVGRILVTEYPSCKAIHTNFWVVMPPADAKNLSLSESEREGLQRAVQLGSPGAYVFVHGTRTSTIGFALASNPLALLAWIGEKFLDWTDEDLSIDMLLESVTLYWLTETFPRSIYPYRQYVNGMGSHPYVEKPVGHSWFPKEVTPTPKSWIATTGNLVFFRQHMKGGHFAALERPGDLLEDVEDFVAQVWPTASKG